LRIVGYARAVLMKFEPFGGVVAPRRVIVGAV
jgi:hypothetical protein